MDRGHGRRAPFIQLIKATLLLGAMALGSTACGNSEVGPTTEPAEAPQTWEASDSSPLYRVRFGPSGPQIVDADGVPMVDLGLSFTGQYGEEVGAAGCAERGTCTTTVQDRLGDWETSTKDDTTTLSGRLTSGRVEVEARWSFTDGDPRVGLDVSVTHNDSVWIDREALVVHFHDAPAALGSDLRFARLADGDTMVLDRWTPHRVVAGSGSRASHFAVQGLESMAVTRTRDVGMVTLELGNALNTPLVTELACNGDPTDGKPYHRQKVQSGERRKLSAKLWIGHSWAPVQARTPRGVPATLAIIDSSTTTDAARLRALLWGHSNPEDPRFGNGGALGHNLRASLALYGGPHGFGNPEMGRVARQAALSKVAFANRSATPQRDDETMLDAGLAAMRDVGATMWFEPSHGECEGLRYNGWKAGGTADKLKGAGYQLVVEPGRTVQAGRSLDLLATAGAERPVWLWKHRGLTHLRPWQVTADDLLRRVRGKGLEQLVRQRGIAVVSTPLATSHLVRTEDTGATVTDGRLEGWLFDLTDASEHQRLWVTTPPELLSRLEALEQVAISPQADGTIAIDNESDQMIREFALVLAGDRLSASIAGKPVLARPDRSHTNPETIVWFDLPRDGVVLTVTNARGEHLQPLIPVRWDLEKSPSS